MLKQPERESRNVNALFYEMEGRQIQKNEQGTGRRGTDKSRGKNSDMACRMGRKYRRTSAVSHRKSSPNMGRSKGRIRP